MSRDFDSVYREAEGLVFGESTPVVEKYLKEHELTGRALDLGCGDGRDSLTLAEHGLTVTSVDQSEEGIRTLQKIAEERGYSDKIEARAVDVREFEFPKSEFNIVVSITCLDHLPHEDILPILGRIISCLQEEGVLILKVHTKDDPGYTGEGPVSGLSEFVQYYFGPNELLEYVIPYLRVISYSEKLEWDRDHGEPHMHGFASLVAVKTSDDSSSFSDAILQVQDEGHNVECV